MSGFDTLTGDDDGFAPDALDFGHEHGVANAGAGDKVISCG